MEHPITHIDPVTDRFALYNISNPDSLVFLSERVKWPTLDGRPWVPTPGLAYLTMVEPPDQPTVGWQHAVVGAGDVLSLLPQPWDASRPIGTWGTVWTVQPLPAEDQVTVVLDTYARCVRAIWPTAKTTEDSILSQAAMLDLAETGEVEVEDQARLQAVRAAKELLKLAQARRDVLLAAVAAGKVESLELAAPAPGGWPVTWAEIEAAAL